MPIISNHSPIRFADALPEAVDTVVIGAGVVGVATAWYLLQAGRSVLICEKGRVAGEQSSRNWGWIRQQGRDAAELPIMIESLNAWEALSKQLDVDIGFSRQGVLYLAETETELAARSDWLKIAQQHQLDTRMLSSAEIDELFRSRPGQWRGGIFTPSDARAEPALAVPALARAVQRQGGRIREHCAVRALDTAAGRVCGVVTEAGRVKAESVVCCGGAWSGLLLGNHGVDLPQLTVRASVARTAPAPFVFGGGVSGGGLALRRRQDGGYTVASGNTNEHYLSADSFRYLRQFMPALRSAKGSIRVRLDDGLINRLLRPRRWQADQPTVFEQSRVLNPAPSVKAQHLMRVALAARIPDLATVPFVEAWAGMIDVMPDVVPVMDEVAQLPGAYVATGFSGHGFGIGPGAGRVMADLVSGHPPGHDLSRFRLARFHDGTPMQPGPGL